MFAKIDESSVSNKKLINESAASRFSANSMSAKFRNMKMI